MIAVSSCRPMGQSAEYDANQKRAWESWQRVFVAVAYFNDPQPELSSDITRFVPSEPYPLVIDLVQFCAEQSDWCAILNADIVLTDRLRPIEQKLKARKASCASSWRHEFDPARGIEPRSRVDNGLDFFAASPEFWAQVYHDVPETLRLGAQRWDSWMLAYFGQKGVAGFYDLTPSRCVCHPKHDGRAYGPAGPDVHFHGWPVMSPSALS
jgi:hypothetical protein